MNNNDQNPTEILGDNPRAQPQSYRPLSQQYQPQQASHAQNRPAPQKTEVLRVNKPPKLIGLLVGIPSGEAYTLLEHNLVGRHDDPQCNIRVADETVSSRHVAIKLEESAEHGYRYFIQDLATTNGTHVNGKEIVRHYLEDGDKIQIGKTMWIYKQVSS